jgi:hypothetical protein
MNLERSLIETVIQVLRIQPEACILLCAPSNPATDTLVLRLPGALQPHEMYRLNNHNGTFAEVPHEITQSSCTYLLPFFFSLPSRFLTSEISFVDLEDDCFVPALWENGDAV